MKRWIDLTPHGMRLKIAILPTAKVLVIENGDVEAAKVKALGFVRRDNGAWMRPGGFDINPREFIRSFPKAVVRDTPDEEFIVRVSAPAAAKVDEVPTVPGASPAKSTFIGINRLGHEVHETEDGRHTVDQRGRSTREHSLSIAVPGLFLRATDNASLQECIDGYLTHCLASERYPLPEFQRFLRTISPDGNGLSKQALSDGILSSAEKLLSARDKLSLRDKFSRAISFEAALRGFEPDSINMPLAIAVRRMMGTDLEMLGQSVVADGAGLQLINGLLPRGSRIAAERAAASMSVDFAGGDQKAILSRLSGRGPSARSFVFLAASGPEDNRAVLKSIASSFFIEAVGNLTADAGGPGLLAVIGSRLDVEAPHADPTGRIRDVEGYPDLWSWATDVSISRAKQVEAVKSGIVTDADLTNADPSMLKNNFQVPYASASKAVPSTMVPKELDGPTRQSLDRVVATYGDIDHQVALDFGIPEDDLHGLLAAEQIDFLGIYLTAEQRNRNAVLLADGPGAGKGRPLAAIAKRAVMQGKRVIFLTEREINLGDFHRDVTHIKANDLLRPYVMNEGASLVDEVTGNKFEVGDQAILKRAVSEGVWPEGVEVIYATYSQFNRPASDSARAKWLQSVVSDDVVLLMDECHNAAGNSETSRNMEVAVEKCGFAVFSSGTYSANANMMRFYKKLFPDTISSEEIVAMMGRGGEEFQEVIAAMLVADGVMVRRELDLSKIEFSNVVDSERIGRNHELMDKLALIISEMASLSGELDEWVGDRNRNDETNVKSIQLNRASFGSPLYLMTRMFSAALLSDLASERAIAALKNNEKPVVLVENTVQAILEDFAAKDAGAPDFRAIVHRILNQITSARTVDEDGAAVGDEIDVANEAGQDVAVAKIRRLIDALPVLPASPIDYVRDRIEAEGFTCGEITGRSLTIRNGNVVARTKAERDRIANKNGFNSGKFDALIVNVSGSTGVDMHAGRRFKDKRRRVLVELQGPAHVLRQVQAYFRVCRRDQDSHPRIEMLSSGLPAEARLGAMRNQKLRRLSANVSSNRDNAFLATNIPDLINSVGDIVITRYMEMRPDLVERLHLNDRVTDENEEADRAGTDAAAVVVENAANRFLSRLMLLPASAQEKILSELTSEYEAQIEELEARGINPLRPREMDGVVHIRENKVFEHGSEEGANTVFDSALHMTNVMVERVVDPLRADAVVEAVEAGSAKFSRVINAVSNLTQNREAFIEQYLPKTTRTVDEALARGAARATMVNEAISMLIEVLPQLVPGRALNLPFIENTGTAVITSVSTPKPGFEHIPSLYWVDIASPGATTIAHYNLSGILQAKEVMTKDEDGTYSVSVKEGLEGSDYDQVLDEFENAVAKKMTPAVLLTSNVFKAVRLATQHKLGRLVSFVDSNGVRNRGVLVNKAAEKSLNLISLRIDNINAAITILSDMRGELTTAPGSPDRAILVTPLSESQWMIRIPEWRRKRNGEVTWPNEDYKGLYDAGEKDSKSRSRLMITSEDDLKSALETIFDTGLFSFYASSKYRSQFKLPEAAGSGMSI